MLYLLESCFHAQTLPLYRSIHEGTLLLMTFLEPSEEKLLRDWLAGKETRPRESRKAMGRARDRMQEAYREAGVEEAVEDIEDVTGKLYGKLSDPSHLRRSGLEDFFDAKTRRAFYRHHPDPRRKLHYAEQGLLVIEHVVMVVGACLQQIAGGEFAQREIAPITANLSELTGT